MLEKAKPHAIIGIYSSHAILGIYSSHAILGIYSSHKEQCGPKYDGDWNLIAHKITIKATDQDSRKHQHSSTKQTHRLTSYQKPLRRGTSEKIYSNY